MFHKEDTSVPQSSALVFKGILGLLKYQEINPMGTPKEASSNRLKCISVFRAIAGVGLY